jgi:hypothetical protein
LHRLGDRFGIAEVVLLSLAVRAHVFRRHQAGIVAKRMQLATWPTTWSDFLPISMPITAIALSSWYDIACFLTFGAPAQLDPPAGLEHGRTIALADIDRIEIPQRSERLT